MINRRKTKIINIGSVKIGAPHPVSIQSMTKTNTTQVKATLRQIKLLEKSGCEIVRLALKNTACADALGKIRKKTNLALVADIHFDYRLGLLAIERDVDGLRLNPGNIYRKEEVKQIAHAAGRKKIPIRVGLNSGSLPASIKKKKVNVADSMVKCALEYIKMLESFSFYDIIISLKTANVPTTVQAYKKMAQLCRYPFHLGITAAGLPQEGMVKSAAGIGALLLAGIGDTIRVSLAGPPEQEVLVAKSILQSLGLRNFGPDIIACPTCGRTQTNVVKIAQEVSRRLNGLRKRQLIRPLKVAIMGCEVNGPGEAQDADIGIACGRNCGILFKKGKIVKKIPETKIVETLIKEINRENG